MDKASVFCEDCFSRPNREEIEKQAGGIHGQKKKAPYMEKVNITGNNS